MTQQVHKLSSEKVLQLEFVPGTKRGKRGLQVFVPADVRGWLFFRNSGEEVFAGA